MDIRITIHFAVQKLTQHCKSAILQLKELFLRETKNQRQNQTKEKERKKEVSQNRAQQGPHFLFLSVFQHQP